MYYSYRSGREYRAKQYKLLSDEIKKELEKQYPRGVTSQRTDVYSGPIKDIFEEAEKFAKQWGKNVEEVSIEAESEYDSTYATLYLQVEGMETDEQYHSRLWDTREATLTREKYERQEFERLSAKFSKK